MIVLLVPPFAFSDDNSRQRRRAPFRQSVSGRFFARTEDISNPACAGDLLFPFGSLPRCFVSFRFVTSRVALCRFISFRFVQVGNCYTASVFAGLVSIVAAKGDSLEGARVFMFSYGSGFIATAYRLDATVRRDEFLTRSRAQYLGKVFCDGQSFEPCRTVHI